MFAALVAGLRLHRDYRRNYHHLHLRHCLLPLLLQAQARQINGSA